MLEDGNEKFIERIKDAMQMLTKGRPRHFNEMHVDDSEERTRRLKDSDVTKINCNEQT